MTGAAPTDTEAAEAANTSGITPQSLEATLSSKLDAQYVEIEDMSGMNPGKLRNPCPVTNHAPGGCGQAFQAIIVSPQFDKKTALARHRLVNSALKEEIAAIHAWTPKCYTPDQWAKLKAERS